jgi:uncharacterized protein YdaU (DUF1376 family)
MGSLKWYKRDPRAALHGMTGMTLEECGAYNKILDLIYCHDGALDDNADYICHVLNCNVRTWRRLKVRLLELGKVYVHAGCFRNERADNEIVNAQRLLKLSAEKANKRWATYNEIKRLRDGSAMQPTTTKKDLSANIVPLSSKRTPEK